MHDPIFRFRHTVLAFCAVLLIPVSAVAEVDCTDGIDNDGDTFIDCLDASCDTQACSDGVSCTLGETCNFATTSCVGGAPTDSLCDNGQFCDGAETCDAVLGCQAGTPPAVGDGVACTDDSCDEVNDVIVNTPNDANCTNGQFCDGAETCDAVLGCQAGTPPLVDDGIACTTDSCDEVGDVVVHAPVDAACSNGFFCDGDEVCNPAVGCEAGTPPNLDDGVVCTDDGCDEGLDQVVHVANDANCSNGQFCDGAETCDAVNDCQAGTPPSIDDGVACTDDSCDEVGDTIVHAPNDAVCDNGAFCNGAETCDPVLGCQAGTPPPTDDGVGCTTDFCDETNDQVVHVPNNGVCDDGLFCNGTETCDVVNDCQNGTAPVVDDGVLCTVDSCDEANDVVVNAPNSGLCDDGLFCNGAETCNATSDCQPGTPPAVSDGVSCTDDSCDEVNDAIVHTPNDANCNDGAFCNGAEVCNAISDCQAGTPPPLNDGIGCTVDSCDETNDVVLHTPNAAICSDGAFCNGAEVCDPVNDCQVGTPPPTNDGISCTTDACDEINDVVTHTPSNAFCDNGVFCDGAEICHPLLDCLGGTPPVVNDGVGCTVDSCDEANDVVVNAPSDAFCDDGAFCNGAETCNPILDCQTGTPPVVNDGVNCTVDNCDEVNDVVTNTPSDAFCDDGAFCNGAETCDPINDCQPGGGLNCNDGIGCTVDSCNDVTNACVNTPNNTICSDTLFCNGAEICDPALDCQPGTAPPINDGIGCTDDACDEVNDVVVHSPNDASCDNATFCDGAETCSILFDCQSGTPPVVDDGIPCTDDSCDEVANVVVHAPNDSLCDDGAFCNGAEVCSATSGCTNGPPPICNDFVLCTSDTCDAFANACSNTPNDGICDNGILCDGAEFCDPIGGCQVGTTVDCDDGLACTTDDCDVLFDTCTYTPVDSVCDDGLFCTGTEVCNVSVGCEPGVPISCADLVSCTVDTCDEATMGCISTADDTLCDNGQFCDGDETCDAGLDCQPGAFVNCAGATVGCQLGFCNETIDTCDTLGQSNLCQDGLYCNGSEVCNAAGGCDPGAPVDCSDLSSDCSVGLCDEDNLACTFSPTNEGQPCDDGDACTPSDFCVQGVCGAGGATTCGDGFIDTSCNEVCDPPAAEICDSTVDLDGDGLIGCLDPDCCSSIVPLCGGDCRFVQPCKTITDAPAVIKLKTGSPDMFKVKGLVPIDPIGFNPVEVGFGIVVSNASGIVYEANLLAGDFISRRGSSGNYKWKDKSAKVGPGVRDGLFLVRGRIKQKTGQWLYSFKVKSYADFGAALESDMAVQVFGVDSTAAMTATWRQTRRGWKLSKDASNASGFTCQ